MSEDGVIYGVTYLIHCMRLNKAECCVLVGTITDLDQSTQKTTTARTLADHLAGAVCAF